MAIRLLPPDPGAPGSPSMPPGKYRLQASRTYRLVVEENVEAFLMRDEGEHQVVDDFRRDFQTEVNVLLSIPCRLDDLPKLLDVVMRGRAEPEVTSGGEEKP